MTEQELESEYNTAKAEMNRLFEQMAKADREKAPNSVHEKLIKAYHEATEHRRLAFNALCNFQIANS